MKFPPRVKDNPFLIVVFCVNDSYMHEFISQCCMILNFSLNMRDNEYFFIDLLVIYMSPFTKCSSSHSICNLAMWSLGFVVVVEFSECFKDLGCQCKYYLPFSGFLLFYFTLSFLCNEEVTSAQVSRELFSSTILGFLI